MAYILLPPDHPLVLQARGWPADPNVKPAIPIEPIPELHSFWGIGGPAGKTDASPYGKGEARLADRNNRLNLHGYYVDGSNEPQLITTRFGEGIDRVTPGGDDRGTCSVSVTNSTAPVRPLGASDGTLFVAAWVKNTGVTAGLIGCQNIPAGEHRYGVGIHISSDGYIYGFRTFNDASKYARVSTPAGNLIVAAFAAKGSTGILSVNGKSAIGTIATSAPDFYVFSLGESGTDHHSIQARYVLDGAILGAGHSQRAWTREELDRATRDFWGTLTRPANQSPFLIGVPAGGGATLTVQSAAHSHSAASPSLVQAHALTPVDALHGHAAESPSLTQANALNPSDSAHDHSAEQPSLSSASIIAAADALHGHTAEQPSVIQAHVLAVVSAAHAHTADNVTLTVGGTLAPDDALHGHLVDAPTLTQAGVLAPADALHGHTAEQPSLVQANNLSPEDAAHAHSAEQPTLDLSVFVTPADSANGHAADSPALTQANLLAVADAVHAHFADSPAMSQHITIVASDALHAHLAASPNIVLGTLPLMSGRVYLSRATLRVYRPVKRLDS